MRIITSLVPVVLLLLLTGCPPLGPGPEQVLSVAGPATLAVGESAQFTAKNKSGEDVTSAATWTSSSPTIVSIGNGGLAQALSAGAATIRATHERATSTVSVVVR